MSRVYVGVDPGFSGALVAVHEGEVTDSMLMPVLGAGKKKRIDGRAIGAFLGAAATGWDHHDIVVCCERVQAYPQQGLTSAFNFGRSFGVVQGVAQGFGAVYEEVEPKKWQTLLQGKPPPHLDATKRKRWLKENAVAVARDLFPMLQINLKKEWGMADAALIAESVRRTG